ncbi:MAG: transporter [Nocardioidaceae bacterium]|nr:transporter [Nocardioidaceae bacterium]
MTSAGPDEPPSAAADGIEPAARLLLALAATAVAFAAADTYVVVVALPDMMAAAGLSADELQRAAPLVSGFLLGYVAMLPLVGRIADLRGRTPVLVGSLVVFAVGSLLTASAYDLTTMVVGRFLQGVGGGGLVPATLALVADMWPPSRRGLPLGVVGAVQELGAVVGPLYGAVVLAVADWRAIFWVNLAVGLVLGAAIVASRPETRRPDAGAAAPDVAGAVLAVGALACVAVLMREPDGLVTDVEWGRAFLPVVGESRWSSPLALAAYGLLALFLVRQGTARRPLLTWRTWRAVLAAVDVIGAVLLAVALGGVIAAFASADPETAVLDGQGVVWLAAAAVAAMLFGWRQRASPTPLVPRGALRPRAAWGAVSVSFFVGAALIAALVDIPFFARLTVYPDSQLDAALVLVRFLVALPVGALVGGWLLRRVAPGLLAATGMVLAAAAFVLMTGWDAESLRSAAATVPLVLGGFGFGLAVAPVNAALLAVTDHSVHGVSSALLVVSRMVGMLVGISALTTIGLRRFYAVSADVPPVQELCPQTPTDCPEYGDRLLAAGLAQLDAVFLGAAVCALVAAGLAVLTLRGSHVAGLRGPSR